MSAEFRQTDKQTEIMGLVLAAADAGDAIEFRALKAGLSYGSEISNQALQCSVRFLERHGMVARSYRAARRCFVAPTLLAYQTFRPGSLGKIRVDPDPKP